MKKIVKLGGIATVAGGVFLIFTNAVLTPMVGLDDPITETAKTSIYFYRMCSAAITAALLLFGTTGLYLHQIEKIKIFGSVAFLLAFIGGVFLFANEWYQIFVIPDLAKHSPDALIRLDSPDNISRYDLGAMIALSTFLVGWILFSISMLRAKIYSSWGPILLISGFFIVPILSGILNPLWGTVAGNIVLGTAFCMMGREAFLATNRS